VNTDRPEFVSVGLMGNHLLVVLLMVPFFVVGVILELKSILLIILRKASDELVAGVNEAKTSK
jgi:hypothetical protein